MFDFEARTAEFCMNPAKFQKTEHGDRNHLR